MKLPTERVLFGAGLLVALVGGYLAMNFLGNYFLILPVSLVIGSLVFLRAHKQ